MSAPPGTEQRGRFVWPPRPVVEVPPRAGPAEEPAESRHTPPAQAPPPADGSLPPRTRRPSWRGAVREIESVWFGLVSPPLPDRIAAAGWAADERSAYCGRCGRTVGPHEADEAGCPVCRGRRLPWERLVRLGEYRGLLRDVVHEVKFTRWRRVGHQIGRILGGQLGAELARAGVSPRDVAIVPVPTSFWRRLRRGIDHPLVIARGVAAELGAELVPALERSHRPPQTALPASRRRSNVAGSIRVRSRTVLAERVVVVVDDVTTTRATLAAACRALAGGAGFRVWTAVLAVTPEPGRRGVERGGGGGPGVERAKG